MSEKGIFRLIFSVSILVVILIAVLRFIPKPENPPNFVFYLPMLNAIINGTCFLLLAYSLFQIKKRNIKAHKTANLIAFFLSSLFLISYVIYHYLAGHTDFPKDNPWRGFYLFILLTHIVLSAVVLPMVLLSFYRGLKGQVEKHRKIGKWTMPIWLYVTLTGVIVYLMISPHYEF